MLSYTAEINWNISPAKSFHDAATIAQVAYAAAQRAFHTTVACSLLLVVIQWITMLLIVTVPCPNVTGPVIVVTPTVLV